MLGGIMQFGLRGLQLLFTLLITALIGNVIDLNNNGSMAAVNFAMFVAVLSWIATLYGLAAVIISAIAMPLALLALDGLVTLFTLIAGIVLAARLGTPDCGNLSARGGSNHIVYGANNDEHRCRTLQASTAFMWFLFACYAVSALFTFLDFRRGGGSVRGSKPNMAQVGA